MRRTSAGCSFGGTRTGAFFGPQFPTREEVLGQFDRVVEKHPQTTFIAAHLGNYAEDLAQLGDRFEKYPNLYADISAREAEWGRQPYTARKFFIKYADRLLFGSDRYPGRDRPAALPRLLPHPRDR